jgi:hypothetical protein
MTYAGSCLCGAVRFEITGQFEQFYLCHCDYCRKGSGSAHGANLFSSTAQLTWIEGEDKKTLFQLPATRHHKCFCSICGSALPCTLGTMLVAPAGSLDRAVSIKPDAHIFTSSRAAWDDRLELVPSFERFPA